MRDNCPFCQRIAAGEYDFSDTYSVAFQAPEPGHQKGHLLVVPRKHVSHAAAHPITAGRTLESSPPRSLGPLDGPTRAT